MPLRFIMHMDPSATLGTLINICQELNGLIPGASRFSGACDPLSQVSTVVTIVQIVIHTGSLHFEILVSSTAVSEPQVWISTNTQ